MSDKQQPSTSTSHIDIGGIALPRHELAEVLPDIARFERHLPDALSVDADMKKGDGSVPAYVSDWSVERVNGVIATLKEIGSLREQTKGQIDAKRESDPRTG